MKQFITAIAITAIATVSYAQRGQNDRWQDRNDRNDRDQYGQRGNSRVNQEAMDEINQGQKSLADALPVYRGRRNTALDLSERAEKELRNGMANERNNRRGQDRDVRDNVSLDKYSQDQVRRSNEKMREASKNFEDAIRVLNRSGNGRDNQNRNRDSINDLRKAIDEIKKAIDSTRDYMTRNRWDRDDYRNRSNQQIPSFPPPRGSKRG